MNKIDTMWKLRPGRLEGKQVRDVLTLAFTKWGIRPSTYGKLATRETDGKDDVETLVAFYEHHGELYVRGPGGTLAVDPDRRGRSAIGYVAWFWSAKGSLSRAKLELHASALGDGAEALGSPYAFACREGQAWERGSRIVQLEKGKADIPKVRTYRDGLAALFWRNFFGPEFTALFGDRLTSLPGDVAWRANGGWIVQPYAQPDDTFAEEGRRRERETIAQLGAECFYDDDLLRPPSRVPHFAEEVDPLPPLLHEALLGGERKA